jgi:ribose 5-phosphate isomerase B
MGERTIGPGLACDIADIFINTEFEGGRHKTRVDMFMAFENE